MKPYTAIFYITYNSYFTKINDVIVIEITSNDLCDGVNSMEIIIYLLVDSSQHRL